MNPFESNQAILIYVAGVATDTDYNNARREVKLADKMRELGLDPIEIIAHTNGTSLRAYAYSDTPPTCHATIGLTFDNEELHSAAKLIRSDRCIEDAADLHRTILGRVAPMRGEQAMDYNEWYYVPNNDTYYAVIPVEGNDG